MAAQYDDLAVKLSDWDVLPVRSEYLEGHTFFKALGAVEGQSVLDLACGDGLYTRQLQSRGAHRVVGVDISEEMIRVARQHEAARPLGIEYHVADVAGMTPLGVFDCVTAVYLLHYAQSPEHLLRMCRNIHAHLKPGGRFVTYAFNPEFSAKGPNSTRYGIKILDFPESPREGQTISAELSAKTPFTIHFSHWSRNTYESALREAGFHDLTWTRPECSPEGIARYGQEFWQDYLDNPHAVALRCAR
ncbi:MULTISPECIES: class I SAM-dependent methyltransferase [unclassified Corallococcus]|uniref:class I SAM-dependent methyltransferase n=1 Tax=unclassified Corallococcus TaxID=2685029 RepID=UPI001A9021FE|nr:MULTISPECIES: class I SAM-dependent methyltransferase [unclassified Corallococcus]MBN9685965.1 class I SAM-dependent methyltransferase [Corallococcus sp. NCSPR001]WAS82595.1 class I SAM-dependent methyltransferase [Corallococcus sp. NCRR]